MTRDEIRRALLNGNTVMVGAWSWYGTDRVYMTCGDWNCCSDDYDSIDEAIESMDWYGDIESAAICE